MMRVFFAKYCVELQFLISRVFIYTLLHKNCNSPCLSQKILRIGY